MEAGVGRKTQDLGKKRGIENGNYSRKGRQASSRPGEALCYIA
jgi:hypothetical protein